jgi:hypothetical protein
MPIPTSAETVPALVSRETVIPIKNASFTDSTQGSILEWTASEHNTGESYSFELDSQVAHTLPTSARIRRYGAEIYGLLSQQIRVQPDWVGKTVRLKGFLRTEQVDGTGGGLILQATSGSGSIIAWDHMDKKRVKGNENWKMYSVEIKVPPTSYFLNIGAILEEGGTLWVDELSLVLVD